MPVPIVGPIVIAAFTAAVGSYFQNRSAKLAEQRQHRDAELALATKIFDEVSTSIDRTHFFLRSAAFPGTLSLESEVSGGARQGRDTWDQYDQAMMQWATQLNRHKAQIKKYFGEEDHERFQEIGEKFKAIQKQVEGATSYRSARTKEDSEGKSARKMLQPLKAPLETLAQKIEKLVESMMTKIQEQTVGALGKKADD